MIRLFDYINTNITFDDSIIHYENASIMINSLFMLIVVEYKCFLLIGRKYFSLNKYLYK